MPARFESVLGELESLLERIATDGALLAAVDRARQTCVEARTPDGRRIAAALFVGIDLGRLGAQEIRIAALVGQGLTNRGIGELLRISEGTVGKHLSSAFRKCGVKSRAELSRFAGVFELAGIGATPRRQPRG